MADTWFKTKVDSPLIDWMFSAGSNSLPEPPTDKFPFIYFELHQKDQYIGWVCISKDGTIEFGEPGV